MKRLMMIVGFAAITAMAVAAETNKVGLAAKVNSPEKVVGKKGQTLLYMLYCICLGKLQVK